MQIDSPLKLLAVVQLFACVLYIQIPRPSDLHQDARMLETMHDRN